MALAQALDTRSVYVAKRHAIQTAVQLYTRFRRVKTDTLIDSGATENFIHPRLVKKMKLQTKTLAKPQQVKNIDGSSNKAGLVTQIAIMEIHQQRHRSKHQFFMAEIDRNNILLGYPFLEAVNPLIDWKNGRIFGAIMLKGSHKGDNL